MNFFKKMGQKIEKYGGKMIGQDFSRKKTGGDANAPQGPQFTDAARSQAAGAGTVGFTQRTQNY
jgi:hypothetical protein